MMTYSVRISLVVVVLLYGIVPFRAVAQNVLEDERPKVRLIADLKETLTGVEISLNGTLGVAFTEKGQARLWNLKDATESKIELAADDSVLRGTFSGDGKLLLMATRSGDVIAINVETRKVVWRVSAGKEAVSSLSSSPDGRQIVGIKSNAEAVVWNSADGAVVFTAKLSPATRLLEAAFSKDSKRLTLVGTESVSQPKDPKVVPGWVHAAVLDAQKGQELRRMPRGSFVQEIRQAFIFPDDDAFATSSEPRSMTYWSIAIGQEGGGSGGPQIETLAASPIGRRLLQGLPEGTLRIIELDQLRECYMCPGQLGWCKLMSWSRDGKWVLSASGAGELVLWAIPSPLPDPYHLAEAGLPLVPPTLELSGDTKSAYCARFLPGEPLRAISASSDHGLILWDVLNGKILKKVAENSPQPTINDITISPDVRYAAVATGREKLSLFHLERWQEVRQFQGHVHAVGCVAFSPDGTKLISGSTDETARVWDIKTGKELKRFGKEKILIRDPKLRDPKAPQMFAAVQAVGFSPDGRFVAMSHRRQGYVPAGPRGLIVFDAETWEERYEIPEGGTFVFSPDRRQLVAINGATLTLIETESGKIENRVTLQGGQFQTAAISPDLRWLALGDGVGVIRLLNVRDGLEQARLIKQRRRPISGLSFSPDSRWLMSNGDAGKLYVWDLTALPPIFAKPEK